MDALLATLTRAVADLTEQVRQLRAEQVHPAQSAITVAQACARLGCKKSTVYQLLKERRLRPAGKVGRARLVTMESVLAVLAGEMPRVRGRKGPRASPADGDAVRALRNF